MSSNPIPGSKPFQIIGPISPNPLLSDPKMGTYPVRYWDETRNPPVYRYARMTAYQLEDFYRRRFQLAQVLTGGNSASTGPTASQRLPQSTQSRATLQRILNQPTSVRAKIATAASNLVKDYNLRPSATLSSAATRTLTATGVGLLLYSIYDVYEGIGEQLGLWGTQEVKAMWQGAACTSTDFQIQAMNKGALLGTVVRNGGTTQESIYAPSVGWLVSPANGNCPPAAAEPPATLYYAGAPVSGAYVVWQQDPPPQRRQGFWFVPIAPSVNGQAGGGHGGGQPNGHYQPGTPAVGDQALLDQMRADSVHPNPAAQTRDLGHDEAMPQADGSYGPLESVIVEQMAESGESTQPTNQPQPAPGTEPAPTPTPGSSTVDIKPQPGPDSIPAVDLGPLSAAINCNTFPFGIPCWVVGVAGGFGGSGACPEMAFPLPEFVGQDVPIDGCEAQPMVDVVRPMLGIAAIVSMVLGFLAFTRGQPG